MSNHELATSLALLIRLSHHQLHQRWLVETRTGLKHFRGISVVGRDALKEDVRLITITNDRVSCQGAFEAHFTKVPGKSGKQHCGDPVWASSACARFSSGIPTSG